VFIDPGYLLLTTGEALSEVEWLNRLEREAAENFSPTPFFDCDHFLDQIREAKLSLPRTHPYIAYCTDEAYWRIPTHPCFDPTHYGDRCYAKGIGTGGPLAVHYAQHGQQRLVSCHPLIDLEAYSRNAGIPPEDRPADHLLTSWWSERGEFSKFFFAEFYVANVESIQGEDADWHGDPPTKRALCPLEHYLRTPVRKRIEANPFFDNPFYLTTYSDVRLAELDPLIHFVRFGAREGRFTSVIDRRFPKDLPTREVERLQLEAIQRR
jgi:hypothetical protein